MNRHVKIALGILIALAVFLVIAAVLAILLFPGERIKTMVEKQASAAMGMPVSIGSIGLSFAGLPAVRVTDITVVPDIIGDQDESPVFRVRTVKARINLSALLKKNIEIVSLTLDEPAVRLITREDGSSNLPSPQEKTEEKPPGPPSLPFPITMKSFSVNNGIVDIDNRKSGTFASLKSISYKLSVNVSEDLKKFAADGGLTVGDISFSTGGEKKTPLIGGVGMSFVHEVSGDLTAGNLSLTRGDIVFGGIPASLTGDVTGWTKTSFSLSTGKHEAEKLLVLIPNTVFPDKERVTARGTYSLTVQGSVDTAPEEPLVAYTGSLDVDSLNLSYPGLPKSIDEIRCRMTFTEKNMTIRDFTTRIGGSRFSLSGTVSDYMKKPTLAITADGSLDLREVSDALPQFAGSGLKGATVFRLAVNGPPSEPQTVAVSGSMKLQGIEFQIPKALNHPALINGNITISPSSVSIDTIDMKTGVSGLTFAGSITGYTVLVWPKKDVYADFRGMVTSDLIDLVDMIYLDRTTPMPKPWYMEDAIKNMPIPPNLNVDTSIRLNTVTFGKLKSDSVQGRVTIRDGAIRFRDIIVQAYRGTLAGNIGMTITPDMEATYDGAFDLRGLQAGAFLASFFGIRDDIFSGSLSSSLSFRGAGLDSVSMLKNLTGKGFFTMNNGRINNWDFTRKLGDTIPFLSFDTLEFNRIATSFTVTDRKVKTDDLTANTEYGAFALSGDIGFDTSLDYTMVFKLNEKALSLAKKNRLGILTGLFEDESGTPELIIGTGGTLRSPAFAIDTSQAQAKAKEKLLDEANKILDRQSEDLKKEGKKLLKKLFR